jgi:hypothetical protein
LLVQRQLAIFCRLGIHLLYVSAQLTWWHTLTSTMVVESSQLIAH